MHIFQLSRRNRVVALACAGVASAVVLGVFSSTAPAAVLVTPASHDAEIREGGSGGPEATRGSTLPPLMGTTTQSHELQISSSATGAGANRNVALLKFQIPGSITSSADLQNYADLRVYYKHNSLNGYGSMRLYALKPTNSQNTTWNEEEVMYRDSGTHSKPYAENPGSGNLDPNPPVPVPIGSNQRIDVDFLPTVVRQYGNSTPGGNTIPMPDLMATGNPPPLPIAAVPGYGANAAHARRMPGVLHENAPYSQQVVVENNARYNFNVNEYNNYWNDYNEDGQVDGTYVYLPYINQPMYNVAKTGTLAVPSAISVGDGNPSTTGDGYTDIWNDVPESNRPHFSGPTDSYADDLSSDYVLMGWLNTNFTTSGFGAQGTGVKLRQYASFGALGVNTPDWDQIESTRANLVAFLGYWIDLGYTEFTFLVGPGLGTVTDKSAGVEWLNNINQQLGSKEYANANPGGGFAAVIAGELAPRLILTPEPGSFAVLGLGLGAAGLMRRRR